MVISAWRHQLLQLGALGGVAGDQDGAGHGVRHLRQRRAAQRLEAGARSGLAASGRERRRRARPRRGRCSRRPRPGPPAAGSRPRSAVARQPRGRWQPPPSRASSGPLGGDTAGRSAGSWSARSRRHGLVILPGLDRERPLARRRQHHLGRELEPIEPVEVERASRVDPGRGEHDGVVCARRAACATRVGTLPRRARTSRSGRRARAGRCGAGRRCRRSRPREGRAGRPASGEGSPERRAAARWRGPLRDAAIGPGPAGSSVGRSLSECTTRSTRRSSSASWSSLVKKPLPSRSWRARSWTRSPCGRDDLDPALDSELAAGAAGDALGLPHGELGAAGPEAESARGVHPESAPPSPVSPSSSRPRMKLRMTALEWFQAARRSPRSGTCTMLSTEVGGEALDRRAVRRIEMREVPPRAWCDAANRQLARTSSGGRGPPATARDR